jgi:hypothetical protein
VAENGLRGAASGALIAACSSVPAMARATVGGGVATGISHVVGGGPVGNIIAGVAGGLASRGRSGAVDGAVAGAMNNVSNRVGGNTRTRTRIRTVHEADNLEHPLSSNRPFRGPGNRSGGNNTGSSRLVDSEIQLAHDPATGEQTQW